MTSMNDAIHDSGLSWAQTNITHTSICSAEPTNITEATSTYHLGTVATACGAPQNGDVDGRKVTVASASGGSVVASGTASHQCGHNNSDTFGAAKALGASKVVANGDTFDITAWDITSRDPS